MLSHLHVRDLAIIDSVDVTFGPGLNVITGETGAGKSILVLAIDLLLGGRGRVRADVVRTGADAAEIDAVFDIADDPTLRRRLDEAGFGSDEELGVQRVIEPKGRGRTYLNGRATSAAVLAEVAAGLCDISSQHEHHTLSDSRSHLGFLDLFAGLTGRSSELAAAFEALADASRRVRDLDADERTRADRLDLVRFQLQEIDGMSPSPDEDVALRVERERLRHAERLCAVTGAAEDALYGRDGSICGELATLGSSLAELRSLDPALDSPAESIEAARLSLEDAAMSLGRYARGVSVDPARLAEVDDRLEAIERLGRKYGGSAAAVLAERERLASELEALGSHEELLARAFGERDEALGRAGSLARSLSARRREAADQLGRAISAELASLGMGGARVVVDVTPATAGDGDLVVDGARLGPAGIDRVEFLIAPNRGEEARPLRRIASGGELSRAMLAVKRVLSGLGPAGTYVFDEVDAGVGGAVAEVIGQKLRQVADHHQVLCITHLPQIAVYADRHFVVRKQVQGDRTVSRIDALAEKERLDEVARMLGGLRVTPKTRAAAAEMLRHAERAAAS